MMIKNSLWSDHPERMSIIRHKVYPHTPIYTYIYTMCMSVLYTCVNISVRMRGGQTAHRPLLYTEYHCSASYFFCNFSPNLRCNWCKQKGVGRKPNFFLFAPLAIVSAVCAVCTRGAVYRGDPCCIKVLSFLPLLSVYRFDSAVYKREYMPLVYQDAHVYWGAVYSPRTLLL